MFKVLNRHRFIFLLISLFVAIAIWQVIVWIWRFPVFILPGALVVAARFGRAVADGALIRHSLITLVEVIAGLLIGSTLATLTGYLLAKSPAAERFLSPYLVASQAVPLVAIAPLLIIWFGPGLFSKILICSLIVFFPVLVNTIVGLRAVPDNLRALMHSLRATRSEILR